jgi:hypothetical protein
LLHVRVVSPAELTGRLVTELAGHPGVRNLVLLKGAAPGWRRGAVRSAQRQC